MRESSNNTRSISSLADLGQLIRERRKSAGLTQSDLAGVAGTSVRLVSEVERGKETAQIDGVFRLTSALGIDLEARPR